MLRALGNRFSWCQLPQQSPFCWNPTSNLSRATATGLSLSRVCNCYLRLMQLAAPQAERCADGSCHRKIFQYHIHINTDRIHENSGTAGSKKKKTTQPSRDAISFKIARVRKKAKRSLTFWGLWGLGLLLASTSSKVFSTN